MARSRLLNVRLDELTRARWEMVASVLGMPVGTFIKDSVDANISVLVKRGIVPGEPVHVEVREVVEDTRIPVREVIRPATMYSQARTKVRMVRTVNCPHRKKPEQYCRICDPIGEKT